MIELAFIVGVVCVFISIITLIFLTVGTNVNKIIVFFIAVLIVIIPVGICLMFPDNIVITTNELVSLDDGTNIHGSFVLGSGHISEIPVYTYYYKIGSGYKRDWIPSSKTIVYMDENINPYLKTTTINGMREDYELHVPEGTIIRNYNLDNK